MPACDGKPDTAFARYRLWCRQGLWRQITDALPARRSGAGPCGADVNKARLVSLGAT
jgi:hypothetical protein